MHKKYQLFIHLYRKTRNDRFFFIWCQQRVPWRDVYRLIDSPHLFDSSAGWDLPIKTVILSWFITNKLQPLSTLHSYTAVWEDTKALYHKTWLMSIRAGGWNLLFVVWLAASQTQEHPCWNCLASEITLGAEISSLIQPCFSMGTNVQDWKKMHVSSCSSPWVNIDFVDQHIGLLTSVWTQQMLMSLWFLFQRGSLRSPTWLF